MAMVSHPGPDPPPLLLLAGPELATALHQLMPLLTGIRLEDAGELLANGMPLPENATVLIQLDRWVPNGTSHSPGLSALREIILETREDIRAIVVSCAPRQYLESLESWFPGEDFLRQMGYRCLEAPFSLPRLLEVLNEGIHDQPPG